MAEPLPRALALVVLVALVLSVLQALGVLAGEAGARTGAVRVVAQVLVLCLAWLLVNSPLEGRVLVVLLRGHGLTTADVLVVPAVLVAGLLAATHLRA